MAKIDRAARWVSVLALAVVAGACSLPSDLAPVGDRVVVTTAAPPPPNLAPALDEVPSNPRQRVKLLAGGEPTEEHLEFMQAQDGYVEGSGRVEAIYPGGAGPKAILVWESEGGVVAPRLGPFGPMTCEAVVDIDDELTEDDMGGWGCGSSDPVDPDNPHIGGMGYTTEEAGFNMIQVNHTPGAIATVIELADGGAFVISPGRSSISYHEWNGPRPARVTVFWPDGVIESELTTP